MTGNDLLIRQLLRAQEGFLRMLTKVPADKLTWQPSAELRSAADQGQEVATMVSYSWALYADRRMDWDMERYMAHKAAAQQFDSHEKIEAELRRNTGMLVDFVRALPNNELSAPVQMPWPGEYCVADTVQYHVWNMAYHEGQIAAILMRLGIDPMG
jgi:uncharacterized damage-inducible protein DinB